MYEEVTCEVRASQLGNLSEWRVVTFQRRLKTKQMFDKCVLMADSVPGTSCSALSETACSVENRIGTFAPTCKCFDEHHPAQEITFMCSDTVARSSIKTAASYALTTYMMLDNTATANNAQSRTVLRDAN